MSKIMTLIAFMWDRWGWSAVGPSYPITVIMTLLLIQEFQIFQLQGGDEETKPKLEILKQEPNQVLFQPFFQLFHLLEKLGNEKFQKQILSWNTLEHVKCFGNLMTRPRAEIK